MFGYRKRTGDEKIKKMVEEIAEYNKAARRYRETSTKEARKALVAANKSHGHVDDDMPVDLGRSRVDIDDLLRQQAKQ